MKTKRSPEIADVVQSLPCLESKPEDHLAVLNSSPWRTLAVIIASIMGSGVVLFMAGLTLRFLWIGFWTGWTLLERIF